MCLICNRHAQILLIDGYRKCEYCKTCIAKEIPGEKKVQKVLEEHATSYILDSQNSSNSYVHETRLAEIRKYSKKS